MATEAHFVKSVVAKLEPLEVSAKAMFGEYGLYFKGKNVGLACNNTLFVKVTEPGRRHAGRVTQAPPYPGAKPAFKVSPAKLNDRSWLTTLFEVTSDALPLPKLRTTR